MAALRSSQARENTATDKYELAEHIHECRHQGLRNEQCACLNFFLIYTLRHFVFQWELCLPNPTVPVRSRCGPMCYGIMAYPSPPWNYTTYTVASQNSHHTRTQVCYLLCYYSPSSIITDNLTITVLNIAYSAWRFLLPVVV